MPTTIRNERQALLADLHALAEAGDLTVEDFGPLHARYLRLRSLGVRFAREFTLLMTLLAAQAKNSDDDPHEDGESHFEWEPWRGAGT